MARSPLWSIVDSSVKRKRTAAAWERLSLCRGFIPSKSPLPHEVATSAVQFVMALSQRLSSSRGCRSVLETRAHLRPRLWTSGCGKTPMQTLRPRRHETVTKKVNAANEMYVCMFTIITRVHVPSPALRLPKVPSRIKAFAESLRV